MSFRHTKYIKRTNFVTVENVLYLYYFDRYCYTLLLIISFCKEYLFTFLMVRSSSNGLWPFVLLDRYRSVSSTGVARLS